MDELRTIFHEPASGAWNMAVDEALLHQAAVTGQSTVRFYSWSEPTLSLGHFQNVADRAQHPPSRNCPVVRRASGGGAILHDRELTYSIVLPSAGSASKAAELYGLAHRSLISALAALNLASALYQDAAPCRANPQSQRPEPFLCFQRRTCFDIVCRGEKIVGSAQRRRRGVVLQHGSVLLARSRCAPELPGIAELSDVAIDLWALASAWLPHLAGALDRSTREGGLEESEHVLAQRLLDNRFGLTEYSGRR